MVIHLKENSPSPEYLVTSYGVDLHGLPPQCVCVIHRWQASGLGAVLNLKHVILPVQHLKNLVNMNESQKFHNTIAVLANSCNLSVFFKLKYNCHTTFC